MTATTRRHRLVAPLLAFILASATADAAVVCAPAPGDTCPSGSSPSLAARQDFALNLVFTNRLAAGDPDGDGRADLVCPNFSPMGFGVVSVLRGTGSPGAITFAPRVELSDNWNAVSAAIADFDMDGRPDLAIGNGSNASAYGIGVHRNTGSVGVIAFAPKQAFLAYSTPLVVAAGDLDGDGKPDMVCANAYDPSGDPGVSVFRNTGSVGTISFAGRQDFPVGHAAVSVAIADIDGDGKRDVVAVRGGSTLHGLSVLRNTSSIGAISFAPWVGFPTGTFPFDVQTGDLDLDGKEDVVVSLQNAGRLSVLRNTSVVGTVSFAASFDVVVGGAPLGVELGDMGCDGKLTTSIETASVTASRDLRGGRSASPGP